ncbi:MAG: transporter substrate-binding domain-containing protein [Atopobiaceae bacterium]|jgi:putative glutamine transport system substrate-binding protein
MITRRGFVGLAGWSCLAALGVAALPGCSSGQAGDSGARITSDPGVASIRGRGILKAGVKTDLPGYGYQNPATGEFEGLEVDLCYHIAGSVFGCSADDAKSRGLVDFEGVTAKTRGPFLDNGQVDVVCATFTITEERKKSWNFSEPYRIDSIGILVERDSGMERMADLDGRIIGVAQGANTKAQLEKMLAQQAPEAHVTYQKFPDYPTIAASLSSGTIDAFSVDRSILGAYTDDSTCLLDPSVVFGEQKYGITTNKYATELAGLCNQLVLDLRAAGELDRMIASHNLL